MHPLTIILTLKDRAPFTYRWMRYMNDRRCPFPILIADGGADTSVEAHLREPRNYPNLSYTYLRYPFDRDFAAYYLKLVDVVSQVQTPYVLFADNDDFYLLEPIPAFLKCLGDNPGVVSCGGTPAELRVVGLDGDVVNAPFGEHYTLTVDTRQKSVIGANGVDRFCDFMTRVTEDYLWSAWYHVHRTSSVKRATEFLHAHAFRDPVAFEIHMFLALLLDGEFRVVDELFLIRQIGTSQSTAGLNSGTNIVERMIASNAFDCVHRSLEWLRPAASPDESKRILNSVARWFVGQVYETYPIATPQSHPRHHSVFRRTLRFARNRVADGLRPARSETRLSVIEDHILRPVRLGSHAN